MTPPDPLTSRLTLERLEAARKAVYAFRDFAREHGMDFRRRDPLVLDICDEHDGHIPDLCRSCADNAGLPTAPPSAPPPAENEP